MVLKGGLKLLLGYPIEVQKPNIHNALSGLRKLTALSKGIIPEETTYPLKYLPVLDPEYPYFVPDQL